ncbi:MAG: cache domain-containing protein [Deltaproteobacteria bacterium]|nr:cache domain-containing protein [Deltaproteobacteria bacterium]
MDLPLRNRLLGAFVGVVILMGALATLAGSFLINRMVIGEAERRVVLALKTAHAMLERRLEEALKTCTVMAEGDIAQRLLTDQWIYPESLNVLRTKCGYDFLHVIDRRGNILSTAYGDNMGSSALNSPVITRVIAEKRPAKGISVLPLRSLTHKSESLAERTRIEVLPTPHAKPGGAREMTDAMVLEAAAPILGRDKSLLGIVRVGTVLNQNFDFVDFVRENVFTVATYKGKNLGTVTIFQEDVRITTNVVGSLGKRAVGTRVSAEVYDRVLSEGETWTGPAFVVDSWYLSAYEPLQDLEGKIQGMLYVGILKKRYDDMRNQAVNLFLGVAVIVFVGAIFISFWLAARLSNPLVHLTSGAAEVTRGNLDYHLPQPPKAERDEINRLTIAFNQMVGSLKERNEELQRSRDDLQRTATELQQWLQNYLEALEFITHELKNQIAAMKINLLAVRDEYVGKITEDQREALDDVSQAINRAEEMILNYLNLSRIEKGELQVHARPLHLEADVLQPVLGNFRGQLEVKGMRVEVRIEDNLFVQGDPSILQIIYENLVGNAAKYGKKNGVLRLSGRRMGTQAELHVWNDGPGVPSNQMDRLFRRFSRIQPPEGEEQERGTGLGLFITRELVRRHGGDIHAESEYPEWIDFVIVLPLPDSLLEGPGEEEEGEIERI